MVAALHGLPDRPVRDAVLRSGITMLARPVPTRWHPLVRAGRFGRNRRRIARIRARGTDAPCRGFEPLPSRGSNRRPALCPQGRGASLH